jgi:hypothetical protein
LRKEESEREREKEERRRERRRAKLDLTVPLLNWCVITCTLMEFRGMSYYCGRGDACKVGVLLCDVVARLLLCCFGVNSAIVDSLPTVCVLAALLNLMDSAVAIN